MFQFNKYLIAVKRIEKYFFSSSACAYNSKQQLLKEEDAYPAVGYGWEKLFSERMLGIYGRKFKFVIANIIRTKRAIWRKSKKSCTFRKVIESKIKQRRYNSSLGNIFM